MSRSIILLSLEDVASNLKVTTEKIMGLTAAHRLPKAHWFLEDEPLWVLDDLKAWDWDKVGISKTDAWKFP